MESIKSFNFTRGDTMPLKFKILDGSGNSVEPTDLQDLRLTCRKKNELSSSIIFEKSAEYFTYNTTEKYYYVDIMPSDTRELPYGFYNFDIQATTYGGVVSTLKSSFSITAEDTIYNIS